MTWPRPSTHKLRVFECVCFFASEIVATGPFDLTYIEGIPLFQSPENFLVVHLHTYIKTETMEVDSGTPADQEALPPRGPHSDDAFREEDDDDDSFGSAASQHDDASLDDDAAMPAHQARHAVASNDDDDVSDDDDEEEAECRVCRGPAEEG